MEVTVEGLSSSRTQRDSIRARIVTAESPACPSLPGTVVGVEHVTHPSIAPHLRAPETDEDKRVAELTASIASEADRHRRLAQQEVMVEHYGRNRFDAAQAAAWEDPGQLEASLAWVASKLAWLDQEKTACAAKKEALERDLALARLAQRREGHGRGMHDHQVLDVSVTVRVPADADYVLLELKYITRGASWFPSYDARLSSDTAELELMYYAEVQQMTGEDWTNATLQLSTATPSAQSMPPALYGRRVRWTRRGYGGGSYMHGHPSSASASQQFSNAMHMAKRGVHSRMPNKELARQAVQQHDVVPQAGARGSRDDLDGMWATTSSVDDETITLQSAGASSGSGGEVTVTSGMAGGGEVGTAGTTTFHITQRVTVRSGQGGRRVLMRSQVLLAELVHEVTPELAAAAFLRASVTNTATYPLLASDDVFVFVDGAFVARSSLGFVSPGAKFHLYLGMDADVKVDVEAAHQHHSKSSSLFANKERHTHKQRSRIKNNKGGTSAPIHVVVLQALPASDDERIEVVLDRPAPSQLVLNAGTNCSRAVSADARGDSDTPADKRGATGTQTSPDQSCECHGGRCFVAGASVVEAQPRRILRHLWLAPGASASLPFEFTVSWPGNDNKHTDGVEMYDDTNAVLSPLDVAKNRVPSPTEADDV